jgi:hypothetical protein
VGTDCRHHRSDVVSRLVGVPEANNELSGRCSEEVGLHSLCRQSLSPTRKDCMLLLRCREHLLFEGDLHYAQHVHVSLHML